MKITSKMLLSCILVPLVVIALFGVVFVRLQHQELSADFFLELFCVTMLAIMCKLWFYPIGEDKALDEQQLKDKRDEYFKQIDAVITNAEDFERYLVILNQERKEAYVKNKMGDSKTEARLQKGGFFFKLFRGIKILKPLRDGDGRIKTDPKTKEVLYPKDKNPKHLTPEQFGKMRYEYYLNKYTAQADRLPPIYSQDIIELRECAVLADSKNYRKKHKMVYMIATSITSVLMMIVLASIAWKQIILDWTNAFKYVTYVCTIFGTSISTLFMAYRTCKDDEESYISRCRNIVRKYKAYKLETKQEVL